MREEGYVVGTADIVIPELARGMEGAEMNTYLAFFEFYNFPPSNISGKTNVPSAEQTD